MSHMAKGCRVIIFPFSARSKEVVKSSFLMLVKRVDSILQYNRLKTSKLKLKRVLR